MDKKKKKLNKDRRGVKVTVFSIKLWAIRCLLEHAEQKAIWEILNLQSVQGVYFPVYQTDNNLNVQ